MHSGLAAVRKTKARIHYAVYPDCPGEHGCIIARQ